MNKLIFLALIMGSLFGNIAPVLASETTKRQDKLITSLSDTLLGLLAGTTLSASVFTVLSCLENKDRNLVNKKLKEYRCFSRNAKELYEKVRLEIPLLKQETESIKKSLVNFQHLLISFDSEIESSQFWFNEADEEGEEIVAQLEYIKSGQFVPKDWELETLERTYTGQINLDPKKRDLLLLSDEGIKVSDSIG